MLKKLVESPWPSGWVSSDQGRTHPEMRIDWGQRRGSPPCPATHLGLSSLSFSHLYSMYLLQFLALFIESYSMTLFFFFFSFPTILTILLLPHKKKKTIVIYITIL